MKSLETAKCKNDLVVIIVLRSRFRFFQTSGVFLLLGNREQKNPGAVRGRVKVF